MAPFCSVYYTSCCAYYIDLTICYKKGLTVQGLTVQAVPKTKNILDKAGILPDNATRDHLFIAETNSKRARHIFKLDSMGTTNLDFSAGWPDRQIQLVVD